MNNLSEIQGQIEKLQKQANEIRSKEFDKTVREIVATMQAFGITIKDLQSANANASASASKRARKPGSKANNKSVAGAAKRSGSGPVPAKYRGPNGEAWSGRGLAPRWLSSLIAQGKKKEDFAIKN